MKIEFNQVGKRWGDVQTLKNINLTIEDGEFVAILGPSGCGKSTSLMLMAGIYECSEGEILFDAKVVNNTPARQRNLSVVFQSYALYPHKTVLENILFPLKYKKPIVSKPQALSMAKDIAKKVQVDHLLDRMPSELSGGQQQRVAMARGLIKQPGLLLLDEPLSNLDATLRHSMRDELKRLQSELGITTVMVTHDQLEAMTMADKIIVMNHGVIEQIGSPEDIYLRPASEFVAKFVGSPTINVLPATFQAQTLCVGSEVISTDLLTNELISNHLSAYDQPSLIVGIRPEGISLDQDDYQGVVSDAYIIGREWVLRLNTKLGELQVVVPAYSESFVTGDTLSFGLCPKHVHIFSTRSGERLASLCESASSSTKAA
ncbi:ABC transporter ATP-binding protein [Vibrio sp. E150_011]